MSLTSFKDMWRDLLPSIVTVEDVFINILSI